MRTLILAGLLLASTSAAAQNGYGYPGPYRGPYPMGPPGRQYGPPGPPPYYSGPGNPYNDGSLMYGPNFNRGPQNIDPRMYVAPTPYGPPRPYHCMDGRC
jgi:hypothetical protein